VRLEAPPIQETVKRLRLYSGTSQVRWDARTDSGHPASSGVYFFRMLAGGKTRSQRTVLVR